MWWAEVLFQRVLERTRPHLSDEHFASVSATPGAQNSSGSSSNIVLASPAKPPAKPKVAPAVILSANVSFIHSDDARQRAVWTLNHGFADAVAHVPRHAILDFQVPGFADSRTGPFWRHK